MCLAQLIPLLLHCEFQAVMPFPKTVHPNQGNYFCRALLSSFVSQLLFLLKKINMYFSNTASTLLTEFAPHFASLFSKFLGLVI